MRLGEYDLSTTTDGIHIDVRIDRVEMHQDHNEYLIFHTNDIAMVYLENDVDFTGNRKNLFSSMNFSMLFSFSSL